MRIRIEDFPQDAPERAQEDLRDALAKTTSTTLEKNKIRGRPKSILISFSDNQLQATSNKNIDDKKDGNPDFSSLIHPPRSNATLLRLQPQTDDLIQYAIKRFNVSGMVYRDWGLEKIDPSPRLSLNFSGPPGTGKTLAAHYIAKCLKKNIIEVSYADIVSKYFGEAAKNLSKLYKFSEYSNAILFIDEAETLLSKRNSGNGDGADHAINSMRSQLLILMENTPIISIFSSNLVSSYDDAFLSRLISIPFSVPDENQRFEIWQAHMPSTLPVASSVSPAKLAREYPGLNGREISRAIIEAAHRAAITGGKEISLDDFRWAISSVKRIGSQGQ